MKKLVPIHEQETAYSLVVPTGLTREQLYHEITAPMKPIGEYSRGGDTCDKLSTLLQFSGVQAYVYILGKGFMRVKSVAKYGRYYARFTVINRKGMEETYKLPWYTEVHTFLGEH